MFTPYTFSIYLKCALSIGLKVESLTEINLLYHTKLKIIYCITLKPSIKFQCGLKKD